MAEPRGHERFLAEVIRRVKGLPVEHVDDGAVSGHCDAEILHPDCRVAAVEMVTSETAKTLA